MLQSLANAKTHPNSQKGIGYPPAIFGINSTGSLIDWRGDVIGP